MNLPNQKTNLPKIQNNQNLQKEIPNEYINTDSEQRNENEINNPKMKNIVNKKPNENNIINYPENQIPSQESDNNRQIPTDSNNENYPENPYQQNNNNYNNIDPNNPNYYIPNQMNQNPNQINIPNQNILPNQYNENLNYPQNENPDIKKEKIQNPKNPKIKNITNIQKPTNQRYDFLPRKYPHSSSKSPKQKSKSPPNKYYDNPRDFNINMRTLNANHHIERSYNNLSYNPEGNCWACDVYCSVSTTGYSPMTFSPYRNTIKRKDVTPVKPDVKYEQYTRHKKEKNNSYGY